MKLLVIGDESRLRKYMPDLPVCDEVEVAIAKRGSSDEEILALAADADFILADAISRVSADVIEAMPNLKLIHSEGVAFNAIDIDAAKARGVIVCNNAGVNASAVAEHAVFLMLACLRRAIEADASVRCGNQIKMKETMMVEGFRELGDCTIGFIGFGSIGKATALRLRDWGCEMLYNKRSPLDQTEEQALGVSFASQGDIARTCDIVSLHLPVTDTTKNTVDEKFLSMMKPDGILINTARGEIVDQEALARALEEGVISMAGLDVLSPEPVEVDNPLLNLSDEASNRLVFSPHIGGVTEGMFYRAHKTVWENIARVIAGKTPINQV